MKIAIVDDLNKDIEIISNYLNTYFSKHCMNMPISIYTFQSGEELLYDFKRDAFDFIFIDYYMNGMSGLDTTFAIRKLDPLVSIIFTTASRDYAVDSYKIRASGYLVKPITYEDFSETLSLIDLKKIREQHFIQIKSGYELIKIPLNDIIYCDISGHYVQIHTTNLGIPRSRMTFQTLTNMLSPYPEFLLCYRGCIINMNNIDHTDDLTFIMNNKERIPLPKNQQNEILKAYSEFLFDKVRNYNYE
ncbi:MAG: response regulator transcription factor [Lachnospiraceae bacterium]|nr:response regulator transcription factor [Lachnospiraceae bacterium]